MEYRKFTVLSRVDTW